MMKHRILLALALMTAFEAGAKTRYGVVTDMQPIENRGEDENPEAVQRRKMGGALGHLVGAGAQLLSAKTGRHSDAANITRVAAPAAGEKIAENVGGPGPTTRYMVQVRLDGGKVLSITQLRTELDGVEVGDRVRVDGSGSKAKIVEP